MTTATKLSRRQRQELLEKTFETDLGGFQKRLADYRQQREELEVKFASLLEERDRLVATYPAALLDGVVNVEIVAPTVTFGPSEERPDSSGAEDVRPSRQRKRKRKDSKRKKLPGEVMTIRELAEFVVSAVKKVGARRKRFHSGQVVDAMVAEGVSAENATKSRVSLVLGKFLTGVKVVGKEPSGGPRPRNLYQTEGTVAVVAASNGRRHKKRKTGKQKST